MIDLTQPIRAAGIMFVTADKKALFLKRGNGSDHPNEWCWPGGKAETGETAEQAAERETIEELGFLPAGDRMLWARRVAADPVQAIVTEDVPAGPPALVPAPFAPAPIVDYTTFIQAVEAEFVPRVEGEHTGFAWASVTAPPQPLHPGAAAALARLDADELGVARMMAAGDLVSPQRYMNVWLFAIRITGTGIAYRKKLDEHVYRNPDNYLTDEFLARCNGLSVIWYHPQKRGTLNSEEFGKRIVGSIFLPYIRGDEVWGIAKIYDDDAADAMQDPEQQQLSTSPAVYFDDLSVNTKLQREDGGTLLIEGKPSLLDHVAICALGVWDKGGAPTGVSREDSAMAETAEEKEARETRERKDAMRADRAKTDAAWARKDGESEEDHGRRCDAMEAEEKERADKAKRDSETPGAKLDTILEHLGGVRKDMDGLKGRMDAMDKERADAAKARKDAEEAEERRKVETGDKEAKERADKAKADAEEEERRKAEEERERNDAAVRTELAEIKSRLPVSRTREDASALADAQARADSVAMALGDRARPAMNGETVRDYRTALARPFQKHSVDWKEADLVKLDDASFAVAERQIYADAQAAAKKPGVIPAGQLMPTERKTDAGHTIREFHGRTSSWMNVIAGPTRQFVTDIASR